MAGFFPSDDNIEDEEFIIVEEKNACENCGAVRFSKYEYPGYSPIEAFMWSDEKIGIVPELPRARKCIYCGEMKEDIIFHDTWCAPAQIRE